ncbi:MAG TPA: hypothetical protein VF532_12530 [Candidatus Angelobacter sp.]
MAYLILTARGKGLIRETQNVVWNRARSRWSGKTMVLLLCLSVAASTGLLRAQEDDRKIAIGEAAQGAVQQSRLTLPGGAAFHLKAHIAETTNAESAHTAEVEEYWVSPEKWRRTIQSPGFSQTLIVNGGQTQETNFGDYYPFWLRDLVTAIFDPLPMLEQLKRYRGVLSLPMDSSQSNACLQMNVPSGRAELKTALSYAFCFQGRTGLLQQVVTPGFRAQFQDYRPFQGKSVAWRIAFSPAPAINIEARITDLQPLAQIDEGLFAVDIKGATPAAEQLKSVQVGEPTARALQLKAPELQWPSVREGKTQGILSLYVSVDTSGRVREVWPFHSDNPEVSAAACAQVAQWQFKPYVNGVAMQMESVLTFAFQAKPGPPIPVLANAEARKLATHVVEPRVKTGTAARGTTFVLRAVVDEKGKLLEVRNTRQISPALFQAGDSALRQWQFRPFIKDGAPDRFYADISFVVK